MPTIVKCTERELAKAQAFDALTAHIQSTFYSTRIMPLVKDAEYDALIALHALLSHNLPKD